MNRKIATFVVTVLVFAMVGTIAWNEFVQGSRGAGEYGSTGARELGSSTTVPVPTSSPAPTFISTRPPLHTNSPSPTLTSTQAPLLPSTLTPAPYDTPTPQHPSSPTPTVTLPLMQVASQFGVNLRDVPGGEVIQGLADGTLVQPYPGSEEETGGIRWLHVVTLDGVEGWLAVNNLIHFFSTLTATP